VNQPLNPRQSAAVRYIAGPCLVLAGAGSGKTSVITRKIAYLVEQCGYKASQVAAVTFTNKAAREMKERVSGLLPGAKSRGLQVSTFHTLGLRLLRAEHKAAGLKSHFSILDQDDARSLLKDLLLSQNDSDSDALDLFQHHISHFKSTGQLAESLLSCAQNDAELRLARLYQRYNSALRAYNAVDFDDLIALPVAVLQQNPAILARWQQKVRYLLVDEYQDTNESQYQLVKCLVGDRGCLTVVGDDDQSIYAWRGARPENISLLKQDYPSLEVIKLEQNYRSTARILRVANAVISHNPHEFTKTLWSQFALGEPLRVIRCPNEEAEAERVAMDILGHKLRRGLAFKDFAVLYRSNHQSRLLEVKLQQYQIPYQLNGGTSFFARTEIKDMLAYFRLLVNPDDDTAFLRIINTPRRQIGPSSLEALGHYAQARGVSLLAACTELGLASHLSAKALEPLTGFADWLSRVRERSHQGNPVDALKSLVDDIDYLSWLTQNTSNAKIAEKRFGNIQYLIDNIENTIARDDDATSNAEFLGNAISKLQLMDLLDRQEDADDADKVQLLTLHASKGLEFPHVYLMGMEEDILPHRNSQDDSAIEEERRLAYVGITRARETLTFTLAASRKQYGDKYETTPSRFLDEIPPEDLEKDGFGQASKAQLAKKADETMSTLFKLFDD
jgi:ATP-dependent DNA helicase Rep